MRARIPALVSAILIACPAAQGCKDMIAPRAGKRVVVELIPMGARKAKEELASITEAEYRQELARVRFEREGNLGAAPLSPELKDMLLERMIDERLLMLEAVRRGVSVSTSAVDREVSSIRAAYPDKQFERELVDKYQTVEDLGRAVRARLMAAKILELEAFSKIQVTEDEARKLWEKLPESEKVRPARVHAAHIFVRTEEEGREIMGQLKKKADFAELARTRSLSPEAARGGDLGWFESGVMPSVFDEVCFSLKPGEVSELTASEYGFHIFKLLESEDEVALTYEDARPRLFETIREGRLRAAETAFVENLRSKVRIVRNEELLAAIE